MFDFVKDIFGSQPTSYHVINNHRLCDHIEELKERISELQDRETSIREEHVRQRRSLSGRIEQENSHIQSLLRSLQEQRELNSRLMHDYEIMSRRLKEIEGKLFGFSPLDSNIEYLKDSLLKELPSMVQEIKNEIIRNSRSI